MAIDFRDSGGAGFCGGDQVRLGFWLDRTRNAGAIAPPQKLVVVGFYRYVRNPMYVGFFVGWLSLWVLYGEANRGSLVVELVAVIGAALFVRLYEEPTLRAKFGADYEEYCRNVPRWIPRVRAWKQ